MAQQFPRKQAGQVGMKVGKLGRQESHECGGRLFVAQLWSLLSLAGAQTATTAALAATRPSQT